VSSQSVSAQDGDVQHLLREGSPAKPAQPQSTRIGPAAGGANISKEVLVNTCDAAAEKKKQEALQEAMKNSYKDPFYNSNFSYLENPNYNGPYFLGDRLKGMADGKLDVGGEFRSRYHHEANMRNFGLTGLDDDFWLTRLRLFTNYRVTENIRFYGEYLYADSGGETYTPRTIEENRGEAQNLFFDFKLYDGGTNSVTARLGRQELLFGAQRLVSPLDWANTRRTFDGYRLDYASKELDCALFYTNPVNRVAATGGTNEWDSSNNDRSFYGTWLTRKDLDIGIVDAYYLGYDDQVANFNYQTLGSRVVGGGDFLLYELQGGAQFGENSNGSSHNACFLTGGLGRKLDLSLGNTSWKPTIWGWYDYASGGTSAYVNRGDNGFDPLFPLGHKYNGFMDLFGRRNLNDVNMQFITPIGSKVSVLLWYHYFFLNQATTPYGVNMVPFNPTNLAGSRDLGNEVDLLATINMDARNSVLVGYSFFAAGKYYDTTPGVPTNSNADFFYAQYQTRF
ncbi:MAG: alginate export family protein, partial [Aureliella sp.]